MAEPEAGIQGKKEDRKEETREERIDKYYAERYQIMHFGRWPPRTSALTLRLERKAQQKALATMTLEELAQYKEQARRASRKRPAWTSGGLEGWIKYYQTYFIRLNRTPPPSTPPPPPPSTKRITGMGQMKGKALKKTLAKMTLDELAKYKEQARRMRRKRPTWTVGGLNFWIKHCQSYSTTLNRTSPPSPPPPPLPPTKGITGMGQMEGKGTWNTDYCPSLENADKVLPKYCPDAIPEKREIYKKTILKGVKRNTRNYKKQEITVAIDELKPKNALTSEDEDQQKETGTEENNVNINEKLRDAIGGLQHKSTSGRAASLSALRHELCRRLTSETVSKYQATITKVLERSLKKGGNAEKMAATKLAPILCIQLGEDYCEELVKTLKPILLSLITDEAVEAEVQSAGCQSLAAISFLSGGDMADIMELMRIYETIFSGSYLQSDGSYKTNVDGTVHAAALDAWSLLLSLCSPANVSLLLGSSAAIFSPSLSQLTELLQAPSVEVRISAGVALSLAYELGLEYSETFGQDEADTIIAEVEQLIRESNKFRSKEDHKNQRATFRNVLKFFEEREAPVERLIVGEESLELNQWSLHVRYHRLAEALASGLQVAARTDLLRHALLMGPLQHCDNQRKNHKQEKHLRKESSKARTRLRAKSRDERSAVNDF